MTPDPTSPPRRLWIVGPSGSGKSTLARRLAERLGVEATSLDDLHWEPGWVERPLPDLVERLRPITARASWVIEGNYDGTHASYLHLADLVVWLDVPISTTVSRVLVRTLRRALRGTPCCNGNRESLGRAFLRRDSIVLWAITSHRRNRRRYAKRLRGRPHVRLRTEAELRRWSRSVGLAAPDAGARPSATAAAPGPRPADDPRSAVTSRRS